MTTATWSSKGNLFSPPGSNSRAYKWYDHRALPENMVLKFSHDKVKMKIQKYLLLRIYLLHTLDQQFTIFVIFFFFQFCSSSLRLSKRGSVNYDWLLGKHPRITSLNIKHYSLRKFYSLPPHFQFTSG